MMRCTVSHAVHAASRWSASASATVAAVALTVAASALPANAQESTTVHSRMTRPDLSEPRTLIVLLLFLIGFPMMPVGLLMLIRRRGFYPIAGRGANWLILLAININLSMLVFTWLGIAYPLGPPCALEFFFHFAGTIPLASLFLIRGWVLVGRLEIMAFLEETRWREEKRGIMAQIEEKEREQKVQREEEPLHVAVRVTKTGDSVVPFEEKLPGLWFVMNRRVLEPSVIQPFLCGFLFVCAVAMTLVGVFDPDIKFTDDALRANGGLPDDGSSSGSQFTPDGVIAGTPCLSYAVKILLFEFLLMVVAVPAVFWILWRMVIDKRRQKTRRAEQDELHERLHGESLENVVEKSNDVDDLSRVKLELALISSAAFVASVIYYPAQVYEPGYNLILEQGAYVLLYLLAIIHPIYLSIRVSSLHRAALGSARARGVSGGASLMATRRGGHAGEVGSRPQHQRPYFALRFILLHNHTYPVLLQFLQKEFSSESALFWHEARNFETAARQLESQLVSWPHADDDEETGTASPGAGRKGPGISTLLKAPVSQIGSTLAPKYAHHREAKEAGIVAARAPSPHRPPAFRATPLASASIISTAMTSHAGGHERAPSTLISAADFTANHSDARLSSAAITRVSTVAPTTAVSHPIACVPTLPGSTVSSTPVLKPATRLTAGSTGSMMMSAKSPNAARQHVVQPSASSRPQRASGHSRVLSVAAPTHFKSLPDADLSELRAEAVRVHKWSLEIFEKYLKRGAMFEINIPTDLASLVSSQVALLKDWRPALTEEGEPDAPPFPLSTLYKATQLCVFDLLARDSFRRFIISPAFARLLQQADEEELAKLEKQADLQDTAALLTKAIEAISGVSSQASMDANAVTSHVLLPGSQHSNKRSTLSQHSALAKRLLIDPTSPQHQPGVPDDSHSPPILPSTGSQHASPNLLPNSVHAAPSPIPLTGPRSMLRMNPRRHHSVHTEEHKSVSPPEAAMAALRFPTDDAAGQPASGGRVGSSAEQRKHSPAISVESTARELHSTSSAMK